MIDFRHETFLALCAIGSYTKTAKYLHLSQPAVTQHIQHLEEQYGCQLVRYESKKLTLTPEGEELRQLLTRIAADGQRFRRTLANQGRGREDVFFGATLTIGEYLMPGIICVMLKDNPRLNVHMEVGNSQVLLAKLRRGELDFALIEGIIDKSKYHSRLFSLEPFVPVCSPNSPLAFGPVSFEELLQYPLILREKGSGTREILENILKQYNYSPASFQNIIEIGNMAAIKQLVASDIGISFMYEIAARKEIQQGELAVIHIAGFSATRQFNFVFLPDSAYAHRYLEFYELMKNASQRVSVG